MMLQTAVGMDFFKKIRSLSIGEVLCVFAVVKRIPRLA